MVKAELKDEIKRMLKEGCTYRQIREVTGVGHWTVHKIKQELEREEAEKRFKEVLFESLSKMECDFKRYVRKIRRESAKLSYDGLKALWDCWGRMEFEYIESERFYDRYERFVDTWLRFYFDLLQRLFFGLSGLLRFGLYGLGGIPSPVSIIIYGLQYGYV